jgi:hypothetical protein
MTSITGTDSEKAAKTQPRMYALIKWHETYQGFEEMSVESINKIQVDDVNDIELGEKQLYQVSFKSILYSAYILNIGMCIF